MPYSLPSRLAAVLAFALALSACQKTDTVSAVSNHICEVSNVGSNALDVCKDGDLFAFLPKSWGNEQLPIIAAAQSCDFNKAVVYNNGTCKPLPKRQPAPLPSTRAKSAPPVRACWWSARSKTNSCRW